MSLGQQRLSPAQGARVSKAIRELWLARGTQALVARELGVSQQTVSAALAGRPVSHTTAMAVARVIGRPYAEVIGQ